MGIQLGQLLSPPDQEASTPAVPGNNGDPHSTYPTDEPSLSWLCRFPPCTRLRVYEGGRPLNLGRLEWCERCNCLTVVSADDQAAVIALIDQHLL